MENTLFYGHMFKIEIKSTRTRTVQKPFKMDYLKDVGMKKLSIVKTALLEPQGRVVNCIGLNRHRYRHTEG